ncbi:hypothetical protein GCK72_025359 [Caenorhabditis remanei]|uniref:Uncharacterized protein n=1 Tax=Caenorhabditis remanei TaxID=31234 RepID=A0A6A5G2I1_CAERE|nr:hypothetical protein GCK72_025359 [Caenorhabditis remanei]KAF1748892.1 hypothetical protein GCK72_025359 [Caenorhabditis remanei]
MTSLQSESPEKVLQLDLDGEETVTAVQSGPHTPPIPEDLAYSGPLEPQNKRRSRSRSTIHQSSEIPPKRGKMDESADETEDPEDRHSVKSEDYTLEPRITVDELLIEEIRGMHQSIGNMELSIAANGAPQSIPPDWIKNSNQISANLFALLRTNSDLIRANNSATAALQRLVTQIAKDQKSNLQEAWLKGLQDITHDIQENRRAIQHVESAVTQMEETVLRKNEPPVLQLDQVASGRLDMPQAAPKNKRGCALCKKPTHPTEKCKSFVGSIDRTRRAEKLNICLRCLAKNTDSERGTHDACPNEHTSCHRCVNKVEDSRLARHHPAFCGYKAEEESADASKPQKKQKLKSKRATSSAKQSQYVH